jgi:hypothetical protein
MRRPTDHRKHMRLALAALLAGAFAVSPLPTAEPRTFTITD